MKLMNRVKKKIMYHMQRTHVLDRLNDEQYLRLMFWWNLGRQLNLRNPKTFNEKLQWLKLHDRKPEYTKMVDKYEAKKYVADRIGEQYIIPTLGVWDKFEDIDFDSLPDQFVLKCTHDSGGLVICRDKSRLDTKVARKQIEKSLKRNYYLHGREWPYKNVKPRIIVEQYMEEERTEDLLDCNLFCLDGMAKGITQNRQKGLTDYKFYCFDGKPEFLYVSQGLENHSTARISFVTLDWQFAPYRRSDYRPFEELPERPNQFNEMIEIAEKLSEGLPFIRVDMYQIGGKVYFSELTFSPCSGFIPFVNREHDYDLGCMIKLPIKDT